MALKKPKITLSEVSQTINFQEELGVDLTNRPDLALRVGQAIIDRVIERTEDENRGIDGRKLKGYSKEYIESDDFQDFDKSPSNVDMTLTGRMMNDIDVLELSGNVFKYGFVDGTETKKAYNHNSPQSKAAPLPERPFFGVNDSDIRKIKRQFKSELDEVSNRNIESETIRDFILGFTSRDVFNDLFDDFFGE